MGQLTNKQQHLTNLLSYAEELLQISERYTADLTRDTVANFHEADVVALEGVFTNPDDDTWIRVTRLVEVPAPVTPDQYAEWLTKAVGTFERPTLQGELLVRLPSEEISDLVEAGLADARDAIRPLGVQEQHPFEMDLVLRLSRLTEFSHAFTAWVDGPWTEWAAVERPRRRSIAFYNKLFEFQQRMVSMGEDAAVECVIGTGIARWMVLQARLDLPLIEASVELHLDERDGAILVRPRGLAPRVALRAFEETGVLAGGTLAREAADRLQRSYDDPDVGFSPFVPSSFEPMLRMCHARLSASGIYLPDAPDAAVGRALPPPDDKLRISDSWVLFVRQRSADFRCDDIRRLVRKVGDAANDAELPAPAVQLVSELPDKVVEDDFGDLTDTRLKRRMVSGSGGGAPSVGEKRRGTVEQTKAYFFPLAFNDEQIEIVRRLDDKDVHGVVVQGPPGTGKTHTIANIICHYMATGRRVLVTARTAEALSAIQHKIPTDIRDLAISVIHSDREGARQLERAIDILASQVRQIDGRELADRRTELEEQLSALRDELADIDTQILSHAEMNLTDYHFRGGMRIPMELVGLVEAERGSHSWFPDQLVPEPRHEPHFATADIEEAASVRAAMGGDLVYGADAIPQPKVLPDVARVIAAHSAIGHAREKAARSASGDLPYVSFGPKASLGDARSLRAALASFQEWVSELGHGDRWLLDLFHALVGERKLDAGIRDRLDALCEEWTSLHLQGQAFALRGLNVPGVPLADPAFDAAAETLARGGKPFGVFSFGKSALKSQIESVRVDGRPPEGADAWGAVRDYRRWQKAADSFLGRWKSVAPLAGLPELGLDREGGTGELLRAGRLAYTLYGHRKEADGRLALVAALFPHGVDGRKVVLHGEAAGVLEALDAAVDLEGHSDAQTVASIIKDAAGSRDLPFHSAVRTFHEALGSPDVVHRDLAEGWRDILAESVRLDGLRGRRLRLEEIAETVRSSGAPGWATALLTSPLEGTPDRWTPCDWDRTWEWARAAGHVARLNERKALDRLTARRAELEEKQKSLLGELVKVRTFLGLKRGITDRIASALAKFAMTVRKLGAGTGKSAERHRRALRESVLEAADAVPCWILPEWRVAEQLPSELGAFDLVIVDEASQSDITSLPAVVRGAKLLIVGDDRQVSPSAVGMEERVVVQLRQTFLRGMPLANYLEPTTSLYDLASMMFPGSTIMLREHFRCVEPIIRFSSRFYPKALVPLRVPTAAERLDPPLIDIYVPHGRKAREVNEAEVDVIVREIAAIVADPAFAQRTVGVVSLIGDKQAKRVYERLTAEVGTEAMARHRIMCGNASTFQGQERDVVFLSMVACPTTTRAQTARMMEQRFNVAMSRARDRMYLVRSVASSMLSASDLKAAVIAHFANPMGSVPAAASDDVLDLCESGFERVVGARLLALGYRVVPQVAVGGFRIDFVVEGADGRRLAVELDGDRYHGPDRWAEDLRRQRALERIGWVFWRCWGSHWLADTQGCLDDLVAALRKQGVDPIGGTRLTLAYTEHRTEGSPSSQAAGVAEPGSATTSALDVAWADRQEDSLPRGPGIVEAGDTVIVRYADDNRIIRFQLSRDSNDPDRGIVHVGQPIAEALLGNGVEEEVELTVGGRTRTVVIEKVMKAAA